MSEGKRPGGLTALAVFNFIFGVVGAVGIIGLATFLNLDPSAVDDPELRDAVLEIQNMGGTPLMAALLALSAVAAGLQVASGIGYLKQRRFLGRTLGNAFATLSIASSLVAIPLPANAGGGLTLGTLIGLIYPVLTLILINTTFKDDLVR